ncbi:MAG TPA: hypothetical protein VNJ08_07565 [Bacteriovoracaceae bacterium]|nr:hypothetical protein [Bacteriovoracaceae bacterium]
MSTNLTALGMLMIMAACSKSNSGSSSAFLVSGKAQLGPIENATVELHCVEPNGAIGDELAEAITAADGSYSLSLSARPTCATMLVLTGGQYVEEASGVTVSLGAGTLRSMIGELDEGSQIATISALTEMAAERFEFLSAAYTSLEPAELELLVEKSNEEIRVASGLPAGFDITETLPSDPNEPDSNPDSPQNQYALVLAGLSELADRLGKNSLEQTALFSTDCTDGDMDILSWMDLGTRINEWTVSAENVGGYTLPSDSIDPVKDPVLSSTDYPTPAPEEPTPTTNPEPAPEPTPEPSPSSAP